MSEWISVKDELPENDSVIIANTIGNTVCPLEYYDNKFWMNNKDFTAIVTHWMPLPEPPKSEK